MTLLKHQNTNTSLYKLLKNHWVNAVCDFIVSVTNKLQSILSFDQPISAISKRFVFSYATNSSKSYTVDKFSKLF